MAKLARGEPIPTEPGRYRAADNLWLQVRDAEHRSWLFRYSFQGKARDMGLGSFDAVSWDTAKSEVERWRNILAQGRDPLQERAALQAAEALRKARAKTFAEVAREFIEGHKSEWRNAKSHHQWQSTLEKYAYPVIGGKPVSEVSRSDVKDVLGPIWAKIPETAKRLHQRIRRIFDYARAADMREGENPARWEGGLQDLLPKQNRKQRHYAAVDWREIPQFMADLRARRGQAARALELQVLTAARSGMVRKARWREFDLVRGIWHVPGENMKSRLPFSIPLSDAALRLLRALAPQPQPGDKLVFRDSRKGKMLSDLALTMVMRRMSKASKGQPPRYRDRTTGRVAVPHGCRSSFRDWCGNATAYSEEHAEAALSHAVKNKVVAAYRRDFAFEVHACLMQDWGSYCSADEHDPLPRTIAQLKGQILSGTWNPGELLAGGTPPQVIAQALRQMLSVGPGHQPLSGS